MVYVSIHNRIKLVPGPPSLFRAMVMAPDAVLVTWKPSLQTNGIINQYTIHMKEEWQKTQVIRFVLNLLASKANLEY